MNAHAALGEDFARAAARLQQSTVHVRAGRAGAGSGVIWRQNGLIVTNAHVARTPRVQIELADGREFDGEVTAIDPGRDLAAVTVDANNLPAAPVGDSSALRVGQLVVAVGNPLGLSGALTVGIIHAIAPDQARDSRPWVQADVHLAPGNSGGPLADVLGQVVGINSMVAGGLGLAVPSNDVTMFLQRDARRGFLGITTQPVIASVGGSQVAGLLILEAEPAGPADRAGLSMGDIITGVAGGPIRGPRDLIQALYRAGPGGTVSLTVVRAGETRTAEVVLDGVPPTRSQEQAAA